MPQHLWNHSTFSMRQCLTYGLSFPRNHACIKGYRHRRKSGSHYHKRLCVIDYLKTHTNSFFLFFFFGWEMSQSMELKWILFTGQLSPLVSRSLCYILTETYPDRKKNTTDAGPLCRSFPNSMKPCNAKPIPANFHEYNRIPA